MHDGERFRSEVLRLLALTGRFLLFMPPVLMGRALLFGTDGGFWSYLFLMGITLAGYSVSGWFLREGAAPVRRLRQSSLMDFITGGKASAAVLSRLMQYLSVAVAILLPMGVYVGAGPIRGAFEIIPSAGFYLMGLRAGRLNYESIMKTDKTILGAIIFALYLIIIGRFPDMALLKSQILIIGSVFILCSMLLLNQANLDFVFISMDRGMSFLPEHIRRNNSIGVLVFFVMILVLVNIRDVFRVALEIAGSLARLIISAILWLAMLFRQEESSPPAGGNGQRGQLELPPEGPGNPFLEMVLNIIFVLIMTYVIYRAAPVVWRGMKDLFFRLKEAILRYLGGPSPERNDVGELDFHDRIEVMRTRGALRKKDGGKEGLNRLKRELRKIVDPVERVRRFYGIAILRLQKTGMAVGSSDTTGEILGRSSTMKETNEIYPTLKELTDRYDSVRYGDRVPESEEVMGAEACLKKLEEFLR